jgi:hypothetical protein
MQARFPPAKHLVERMPSWLGYGTGRQARQAQGIERRIGEGLTCDPVFEDIVHLDDCVEMLFDLLIYD